MNAIITIKIIKMCMLVVLVFAGRQFVYGEDPDVSGWSNYFERSVVNGINFEPPTSQVLRDGVRTNVMQALIGNKYSHNSSFEYPAKGKVPLTVNVIEFDSEENGQIIRVQIIEAKNGRDEVMYGLSFLMSTCTSMGGVVYKVLKNGPGDVSYGFKHEIKDETRGPSVLFFCRDNVAVQVSLLRSQQGDVMSAARLIDSAIMASPSKKK